MRETSVVAFLLRRLQRSALVLLIVFALANVSLAQEQAPPSGETAAPPQTAPADPTPAPEAPARPYESEFEATAKPTLTYTDPLGRFGFTAPAQWGQLPDPSRDEVRFQNDGGDSISVSIAPLQVDPKAFQSAYVETFLKVLQQSFEQVRYIGARTIEISNRKATDYVFSATLGYASVTCHQVVLLGGKEVLYVTFAGYGSNRQVAETLFQTALVTFWVSPGFGGALTAGLTDPNAPPFVIAIPEGWTDQGGDNGNSHVFRPRASRPTSAYISTRVTKLAPNAPDSTVDDSFVQDYAASLKAQHPEGTFEMKQVQRIFLSGEAAVRYDYGYVSNLGIRRAITLLTVRKGYLVGVTCDAVETAFGLYGTTFENLVAGFKFK